MAPQTMEWIEIVQRLATTFATISAGTVAWLGLRAWHVQLRGRTEYDLARRLLRAVFEVRDQIASVRMSFVPVAEIVEAVKGAGLDPENVNLVDDPRRLSLVYQRRWIPLSKALSSLAAEAVEAEVLWGQDVRNLEIQLRQLVGQLNGALNVYLRDRGQQHRNPEKAAERIERMAAIVYSDLEDADAFGSEVEAVVARFEELLRPRLRFRR